eukprot:CAMPEP_0183731102 /NCGR_PEP_ID=MMETSP0737-20130205/34442_1 /TAXON_ID=385413 /ORGANISM="Thalassiosira miniscula, Strain CCMP1093" /LENGTH=69 /DNA_ID=CAMNT_0025963761 /DNA_START=36 /DNA_END=245 /DNA_ORIENTATION=+
MREPHQDAEMALVNAAIAPFETSEKFSQHQQEEDYQQYQNQQCRLEQQQQQQAHNKQRCDWNYVMDEIR